MNWYDVVKERSDGQYVIHCDGRLELYELVNVRVGNRIHLMEVTDLTLGGHAVVRFYQ